MNRKPKLFKYQQKNVVKKKSILSPRSPLQHLNGSISSSTSSSRDGFGSSSSSSSSSLSTTASKSGHNSKTARAGPSCFRSNKSVKVNRLRTNPLRHNSNIASKKMKKILKEVKSTVEQTCTPACNNKVVEDSTTTTKNTPPVQISVSPEIQGGLSISVNAASTASCYGAGHLLSGVTDRRKCRPRGILAVGNKSGCINGENNADLHEFSTTTSSLIMEPLEASMRWLCNNGDEKDIPGLFSLSPPSSSGPGMCKTEKTRVAPPATPCEVVTLQEKRKEPYDWSPFSIDSLSSDNMIQTPESDSIFHHYSKGDDHCSEIQQFDVSIRENISPEDSIGDRCSIDCSSMKELFGSKLSLSLRDGINEIEQESNCCRYLSDDDEEKEEKDGNESFGFGVMKDEEPIPPQHKGSTFAESLTMDDDDSISDLFSRSSNQS